MSEREARFSTGVAGLDTILHGGLLSYGLYVLLGESGAGKTTLASQIGFNRVRAGEKVLYITVLAETHTRLLRHLRQFTFYQEDPIGSNITFLSAFEHFYTAGFDGLSKYLSPLLLKEQPALLVLDGIPLNPPDMPYDPALKGLVHHLQSYLEITTTTCLLLSVSHNLIWQSRVLMMVDGAIELKKEVVGRQTRRSLQVQIFRGSPYEPGAHVLHLGSAGIEVSVGD